MPEPFQNGAPAVEDLVAPGYTQPGSGPFGVVLVLTLALFICAGLYFRTIKPRERVFFGALDKDRADAVRRERKKGKAQTTETEAQG